MKGILLNNILDALHHQIWLKHNRNQIN